MIAKSPHELVSIALDDCLVLPKVPHQRVRDELDLCHPKGDLEVRRFQREEHPQIH